MKSTAMLSFIVLSVETIFAQSDVPPTVDSTTPANGATNVTLGANLTINFSEPVNVTGAWFDITSTVSGAHTATVSGGPQTFMLDPDLDFANDESCMVTVRASQVTDQDADDPPDNMVADFSWSFTTGGVVSVEGKSQADIPRGFALSQNYPNPFNPSTVIRYSLPVTSYVTLKVYNVLGQEVANLVNEEMKPGSYEVTWEGKGFASGLYFYRLTAGQFIETKKLLLLR